MNEFDYLAKAKSQMENEKYYEVISLCDKALKINTELPQAYDYRGNARYEIGEYNSAADDFTEAIKREPNDAKHYFDRSWAYHYMHKLEDAIVDINKAIELEPKTSYYYYDKGRFEYWAHRFKEGVVNLTKGIELKPTENKYIFRGNCYMELEMYDYALSDFNSAIEIEPESSHAYYRKGVLYKKMELLEKAVQDFKKAIELCPNHDDAMIELGFIRIESGKKDGMKYFNKAVKVYPCVNNYYQRIIARRKILFRAEYLEKLASGEFVEDESSEDVIYNREQAAADVKDLNKAIKLNPDDITLYEMRTKRFLYLKEYEKAIKDYNYLIESDPEDYSNYTMRGFCYERVGLYEDAIKDCMKSVELNNGYGDVIIFGTRGLANYKLGNFEKALTDFNQTLELEDDVETYYFRGLVNYRLKNYLEAYDDIVKALELNPDIESNYDEKIPLIFKLFLKMKKTDNTPIGLNKIKNIS